MRRPGLVTALALTLGACDVESGIDFFDYRNRPGPLKMTVDGYGTFHGDATYLIHQPHPDHPTQPALHISASGDLNGPRYRDGLSLWLRHEAPGELPSYRHLDADETDITRPGSSLGFIFGDLHYLARDGHIILDTGPDHFRGRFKVRAEEFTGESMAPTGHHRILEGRFETDRLGLDCMILTGPPAPGPSSPGVPDDGGPSWAQDSHHTSPFCQTVRTALATHAPLR